MTARSNHPPPQHIAGLERFTATCQDCDRTWNARGTINSRRAAKQAQRHADRTGHYISAEWANRR